MGKKSRLKAERRTAPPPVGRRRPPPRRLWLAGGLALAAVIAGIVAGALVMGGGPSSSPPPPLVDQGALPGLLTGPAPWGSNIDELRGRLDALGLPALSAEGTALHIHQHVDIFVGGRRVTVSAGIGIFDNEFISPLHTHDPSGIIHVESPDVRTFTLGQFFGVWGVRLTPSCLGGYCVRGAKRLWLFVDGKAAQGDPRRIVLAAHQEIVVAFGTRAQLPKPIPRSYSFPAGL